MISDSEIFLDRYTNVHYNLLEDVEMLCTDIRERNLHGYKWNVSSRRLV